jgi:hypothetical protein
MPSKWKTLLALTVIYLGVAFDWNWIWGVLFITWTGSDFNSKETFLIEAITRRENSVLYWIIMFTWISLSIYLIGVDLFKLFAN